MERDLLLSHLLTLVRFYGIDSAFDLKHFGFDNLWNPDALNQIIEIRHMNAMQRMTVDEYEDFLLSEERVKEQLNKMIDQKLNEISKYYEPHYNL